MLLVCAQLQWPVSETALENYYVGFMNTIYELMLPYEQEYPSTQFLQGGFSDYTHELAATNTAWMCNLTRDAVRLPTAEWVVPVPPRDHFWPEDWDRWALNPAYDPEFPYR